VIETLKCTAENKELQSVGFSGKFYGLRLKMFKTPAMNLKEHYSIQKVLLPVQQFEHT
jgi:hypothetical protein